MWRIKKKVKKVFHQITGLTIYKKLPFGIDPFEDIRFNFKEYPFDTFFDVGANIGQSVSNIRKTFSKAEIWCFEPVSRTYEILKANTAHQNVYCYQIGFGNQTMEMEMVIDKDGVGSSMYSLNKKYNSNSSTLVKEIIRIQTLDYFCSLHSIDKIDYLKVDTEGYDLNVLKGAGHFILNQRISFIEVEVSMNPENTYHVSFEEIKKFLENFQYRVYGIYEQVQEWPTNTPILRRVNVLFVSETIYNNGYKK